MGAILDRLLRRWCVVVAAAACCVGAYAQEPSTQPANPPFDVPLFHAEARQVLVGAILWGSDKSDPAREKPLDDPYRGIRNKERAGLEIQNGRWHPARGFTARDFHVFDNGVEQRLNYFKEIDFPAENEKGEWLFNPTTRGLWGTPPHGWFLTAEAFYLLGYVPPPTRMGECHDIRMSVTTAGECLPYERPPFGKLCHITRSRYCNADNPDGLDEAMQVTRKMKDFALSTKHGSVDVSAQALTFRSSATLNLGQQELPAVDNPPESAPQFTFVVNVNESKPSRVEIVTQFAAHEIAWEFHDGAWQLPLYILGLIYDRSGGLVGQFGDRFPDRLEGGGKRGAHVYDPVRYDTQIELLPGEYELRVVVGDGKRNLGRAQIPLQIEAFRSDRLSMSDIVLSDVVRPARELLRDLTFISPASLVPTPLISNDVQILPVADARFTKRNPLAVYFEIYEPLLEKEAPTVSVEIKVTDLKSGATKTIGPESTAKWITPGNPVIPIAMTIALNTLSKGSYRVQVQASDSAGRQTEWQQADFTIK